MVRSPFRPKGNLINLFCISKKEVDMIASETSKRSNWYYIDPAGNTQGGFSPQQMTLWYKQGKLHDDLLLRRGHFSQYMSLANVRKYVGDGDSPFSLCFTSLIKLSDGEICEWFYRDSKGKIRGPFTAKQMESWRASFPKDLRYVVCRKKNLGPFPAHSIHARLLRPSNADSSACTFSP